MVSSHSHATITLHGSDRALDLCEIWVYFLLSSFQFGFEQTEKNASLGGAAAH